MNEIDLEISQHDVSLNYSPLSDVSTISSSPSKSEKDIRLDGINIVDSVPSSQMDIYSSGVNFTNSIIELESYGSGVVPLEIEESEESLLEENTLISESSSISSELQSIINHFDQRKGCSTLTLSLFFIILGSYLFGIIFGKSSEKDISPDYPILFFTMISDYPDCNDNRTQIWRYFTSCLVHIGIYHILFNLLLFFVFSRLLEKKQNLLPISAVLLIGTFNSSAINYFLKPYHSLVGCSGMVYTVIGAYFGEYFLNKDFYQMVQMVSIFTNNFMFIFFIFLEIIGYLFYKTENIAYMSHWIGLVSGFFGGYSLFKKFINHEEASFLKFISFLMLFFTTIFIVMKLDSKFPPMNSYDENFNNIPISNCCYEYWKFYSDTSINKTLNTFECITYDDNDESSFFFK